MANSGKFSTTDIYMIDHQNLDAETFLRKKESKLVMFSGTFSLGFGKYFYEKNTTKIGALLEIGIGYSKYILEDTFRYEGIDTIMSTLVLVKG